MAIRGAAARHLKYLVADDGGATVIEYAFIISLVSIAIGALIPEIRASLDELFLRTASAISSAAAGGSPP